MIVQRLLMVGVSHRRAALLALVAVTLLAALGLPRLQVDTGFSSMVPATDPDKRLYEQVEAEFGSDNRTLVYVKDPQLWTPAKLAALEQLHRRLQELPFVTRVDDLYTLRAIRGVAGELETRQLLAEPPTDQAGADRARADALHNPLIVGNYLSADGTATALMVTVRADEKDTRFDRRANDALEVALKPARGVFQQLFQVGPPRINAELNQSLWQDLTLLGPLSALLLVATILFFLRSWFAALVPLLTSALSMVWTFGLMGAVGLPVNVLSAMLPSLVVVIGSTEDIHMLAAYFHGLEHAKGERRAFATRYMLRHMAVPMLLTVFTTALGFASNLFAGIGLIQDFAVAATVAILANGVITVLLVPMLLSTWGPLRAHRHGGERRRHGLPAMVVRLFGLTHRSHSRVVLGLTALLCGFFVYQAASLRVTNDPLTYFRGDRPLISQVRQVQHDLAGIKVFYVTLESTRDGAFLAPANLQKLVDIQAFITKQGIFDRSVSLADQLALINREFHGGDENYDHIPAKRDLVAQYLMFFPRRDLESYVSHDLRRANIVVRHNISDSATLNRYVRELQGVVDEVAGADMHGRVVGENLMINAAAESLLGAQVKSLGLLLVVIFLIISAMFTSLRGGFIALVPSLIPIILMFGVMGSLGIPLNPGTAMVALIAIGIAIDGTIHLFSRYNELCRHTSDYEQAVHTTVDEEATPVVYTSLALAVGFGILLLSNFTLVAQFGALSALTMLFSIFANLLITPLIMSRIRLIGLHQILALSSQKGVVDHSPLFRDMSDYQIRKAILISELHEYPDGDLLVAQGTTGRSMYLVLSGEVEVVRHDDGQARRVATLGAGQVFGEIGFIRETRRTADVRAVGPVSVLRFDYEKIRQDLKFFPRIVAQLNFNISCILGERLADAMEASAGHCAPVNPDDPR